MAMKEGPTVTVEYHDHQNIIRTARIDKVHSGALNTSDPDWIVNGRGNVEWLEYKNENGDPYIAKVHCETLSGSGSSSWIRPWAETKHNGRTQGDVKGILVTDGNGTKWAVEFLKHRGQDLPVTFHIHPFPPPPGY